ncbi:MAG: serine hydrolase [Chloroflexota bacterium]
MFKSTLSQRDFDQSTATAVQPNRPPRISRFWRIIAILFIAHIIVVAPCFSIQTTCGRWAQWREPDFGDYLRLPQRVIANDETAVYPLTAVATPNTLQTHQLNGQPLDTFLAETDTSSFLILRGDQILYEAYFDGFEQSSINNSFSAAKSFISALIGIAIDDGLINSVDDPITQYLPELGADYDAITLKHLLMMQSGLEFNEVEILGLPMPWSDDVISTYGTNLRRSALNTKIAYPPATRWHYNNTNTILLGMTLEQVTGMAVATYLEHEIWQPLGMSYPASWSIDSERNGMEYSGVGLQARVIDFAKFGLLFANNGNWNGEQIISEAWVQESTIYNDPNQFFTQRLDDLIPPALAAGKITEELAAQAYPQRYQYMWWGYEKNGRYDFYANGHAGQFIYVSPDTNTVIVRTGTDRGGVEDPEWAHILFELATVLQ